MTQTLPLSALGLRTRAVSGLEATSRLLSTGDSRREGCLPKISNA